MPFDLEIPDAFGNKYSKVYKLMFRVQLILSAVYQVTYKRKVVATFKNIIQI